VPNSQSLNPSNEITIILWVQLLNTKSDHVPLSHKGDSPRTWWFGFRPNSATTIHWSNAGLTTWNLDFNIPSALNTWRFIAVTYKMELGERVMPRVI
jgi:hypothetical protein